MIQQTFELVGEVRFSTVFAFKYSPRPGTAAPRLDGQVEDEVASERLQRLFALQEGIQRELNQGLVGESFDVVVTGWGRQPGMQTGRTTCHRIVHFPAGSDAAQLGSVIPVQIQSALAHSLIAERIA